MASFHGEVVITTGTQSISGNYTPVTASFYAVRDSGSAYSGYTTYASCTLDGTTETKTISSYNLNSSNTRILLGSITKNVYHNSDGTKTVSASFSWNTQNSYSGTITGSATKTLTTIPRTSKVSLSSTNFNIGSSITINTNRASSSFTHTAVIKFNGSTVRTQTGIGASYSWSTSELYQYIPKANSAKGTVTLTTYSGSTQIGSSSVEFTANVTNSNPTFSNCTYKDMGSVSTQLTGDNQIIINGFNALQVTISTANKAEAKNGATMSKYRLVCGSKSIEASYSSSADVILTLDYVTNMTFIVYAIDSRGNSTAVTKSVTTWKDYSAIAIKTGSAVRTDGVGTETTLTFEGSLWNDNFGAESNEIVTCQYKYKKSNESTYGEPIDIIPIISGNSFSFSSTIKGDADAEGFNVSNSFNIQVIVTDKIKTATYDILLGAGTPAMAIHRDGVAFGAPYNEIIGGCCQVGGKNIEDLTAGVIGDTIPIGAVMEWDSDTIPVNWLLLNGQAVSRTEYKELFALYGTRYGAGDGSTTFNLPNRKTRVSVGKDSSDSDFNTLGKTGGEKKHTLTVDELPTSSIINVTGSIAVGSGSGTIKSRTQSGAHNNLQPYIVTNFIVKAKQSAGVVANVIDNLNSTSEVDALSANQGRILSEKSQKHIMTAYNSGSGTQSINVTSTYTGYPVEFGSYNRVGNKFSISNNKIVIGAGVTKVLVSGMLSVNRGTTSTMIYMSIKKNSEEIAYSATNFTDWAQVAITANDVLIDVQEGDTISMFFATGYETGTYQIRKGLNMTRITVKAVQE